MVLLASDCTAASGVTSHAGLEKQAVKPELLKVLQTSKNLQVPQEAGWVRSRSL